MTLSLYHKNINKKDNIRKSHTASIEEAKSEEFFSIDTTKQDCLANISSNITDSSDRKGSISTMSSSSCGG